MVTKELISSSTKWLIGILIPFLIGGVAWAFQLEKKVSSLETSQIETGKALYQIGDDIRYIRNLIIEEIRKK